MSVPMCELHDLSQSTSLLQVTITEAHFLFILILVPCAINTSLDGVLYGKLYRNISLFHTLFSHLAVVKVDVLYYIIFFTFLLKWEALAF